MVEECKAKYRDMCKTGKVLSKSDYREAEHLEAALTDHLRERANEFLLRNRRRAVLFSYGADGTPCLAQVIKTCECPDGTTFTRSGRENHDLLLQRGCLLAEPRGGGVGHCARAPRTCSLGGREISMGAFQCRVCVLSLHQGERT